LPIGEGFFNGENKKLGLYIFNYNRYNRYNPPRAIRLSRVVSSKNRTTTATTFLYTFVCYWLRVVLVVFAF
jgi:hypothetical protein